MKSGSFKNNVTNKQFVYKSYMIYLYVRVGIKRPTGVDMQ